MTLTIDSSMSVPPRRSFGGNGSLDRRSRTGCLTCKIRRVKCDEARPSCDRCTSTGRKCDGYAPIVRKARRSTPTLLMVVSDTRWLGFDHNATNSFQYFCEVMAPRFANFGTLGFWNSIVPQACHTEESIRHLVIATSYLGYGSRSSGQHEETDLAHTSFLTHYGKAMKLLSNHDNIVVLLIACLLFVVCEDYRQNTYAAITHIQAARKLVAVANQTTGGVVLDMIASILQMLVIHSPELSAQHLCITRLQYNITTSSDQIQPMNRREMSASQFHSVKDASTSLKPLVGASLRPPATRTVPATRFHVLPGITENLNDWLECLNRLTAQADRDDFMNVRLPLYKLRVRHLCLHIISRCAPFDREVLYDSYQGDLDGLTKKLSIMLDLGADDLLSPLFFIACKYRDPAGRRRAAEMLRYQVCGEEGTILADIADRIILMEEEGINNPSTCGDIPEGCRYRPEAILADLNIDGLQLVCSRYPYRSSGNKRWSPFHSTARPSSNWSDVEWMNAALLRALNFHFDK